MTKELETQLQGHLSDVEWEALKTHCKDTGIILDEQSLEYGSGFINAKSDFIAGWEAGRNWAETNILLTQDES